MNTNSSLTAPIAPIAPVTTEPNESADDVHAAVRLLLRKAEQVYGVHETAWLSLIHI